MNGAADSRTQAGFTLVELLLATSIGVIITGVAVMAIWHFMNLTRQHEQALTVSAQLQQAAIALNRDVVAAAGGEVQTQPDIGEYLFLEIPRIPEDSFGSVTDPITSTVAYTYTLADGTLTRGDSVAGDSRTVASYIDGLDFGPAGEISSTMRITIAAARGDQSAQTVLELHRRADGG